MKLVIAIVNKDDSAQASAALNKAGFYVTKLASSGGFLRKGNVTLFIGTDEEKVPEVISIIKSEAKQRVEKMPTMNSLALPEVTMSTMIDVVVGGATIFVLDVDQFEKF